MQDDKKPKPEGFETWANAARASMFQLDGDGEQHIRQLNHLQRIVSRAAPEVSERDSWEIAKDIITEGFHRIHELIQVQCACGESYQVEPVVGDFPCPKCNRILKFFSC